MNGIYPIKALYYSECVNIIDILYDAKNPPLYICVKGDGTLIHTEAYDGFSEDSCLIVTDEYALPNPQDDLIQSLKTESVEKKSP